LTNKNDIIENLTKEIDKYKIDLEKINKNEQNKFDENFNQYL